MKSIQSMRRLQDLSQSRCFLSTLVAGLGISQLPSVESSPSLENRIIVQDIPVTFAHAIPHPGDEILEQNFFEPQDVTGE